MVNFAKPENTSIEFTLEEIRLINIALLLAVNVLRADVEKIPETITLLKLGALVGMYNPETAQSLVDKLKGLI